MAYDWNFLAQAIERAGGRFAERLEYDYRQKQEEKRVMNEYEAKLKLEEAAKEREEGRRLAQEKEMSSYNAELDAQRALRLRDYEATLDQYFKSPELMNTIQTYNKSADPNIRATGQSAMSLIAKLREGRALSQDEHNFLSRTLPGNSYAPIADMVRANQDREREYGQQKALISYYQAIGEASNIKSKDVVDITDISNILKKVSDIDESIAKLESSPQVIAALEEIQEKNIDINNLTKEGLASLTPTTRAVFLTHMKNVSMMRQTKAMLVGLLRSPEGKQKLDGQRPPAEQEIPIDKQAPTEQEPQDKSQASPLEILFRESGKLVSRASKSPVVAKPAQGFVGGIYKAFHPEKEEPPTTVSGVRQKFNIPKNVRIYSADTLEDLKKLPGVKKNPPRTGDLAFIEGKLYKIKITDGKIHISKEPLKKKYE